MNCCQQCAGKRQAALSYYVRPRRARVRRGAGLRGLGLGRVRLGALGYSPNPPTDAASYEAICVQPLPPNTTIVAVVQFPDTNQADLYFNYTPLPGSSQPPRKWVCTISTAQVAGVNAAQSPVVAIDPSAYDASPDFSAANVLNPWPAAASISDALPSALGTWGAFLAKNWLWIAAIALGAVALEDAL